MTPPQRERIPAPALATGSLRTRLRQIHERLRQVVPVVERISCVLYDEHEGTLKTFIDSTLSGELLTSYERKLVDCPSLERLARSGELRIVEDIPQAPPGSSRHALWLAKNGYRSSMTVPLPVAPRSCRACCSRNGRTL